MILECDIGNSRCKWRLLVEGMVQSSGVFGHASGFEELPLAEEGIKRVRVVSVATQHVMNDLAVCFKPFL